MFELKKRYFVRLASEELASTFKIPTKNILPLPKGNESYGGITRGWFARPEDKSHTEDVKKLLMEDPRCAAYL